MKLAHPVSWTNRALILKSDRIASLLRAVEDRAVTGRNSVALKPLTESLQYETDHTFSPFANWIIPGQLMAGRYPYIEPGLNRRCDTHESGILQIQEIMKTDIRTFLCLQEELPPQKRMPPEGVHGFLPYHHWCEQLSDSVDFLHFPVEDLSVPKGEELVVLLAELETRLFRGEKMYIHCCGGRGRAGVVACCLIAKAFKISAEEALERVGRAFLTRNDSTYRSPQTAEQVQIILSDYFSRGIQISSRAMSEVETIIERIQQNKGVRGLLILDRYGNIARSTLEEHVADKYRTLIPELSYLAKHMVRDLDPQNDLEFYRVRSKEHEIMIAAYTDFDLIVIQDPEVALG